MAQFEEAVERVVAGLEKKNRLINPKERTIVAYHELGHAIVSMSLPDTDPVQKITIVPRGIAALGYTMQLPTEDRYLMSKAELFNKIAVLLGGRAAERAMLDEISTGAHNDLARATDIARSMIIEYGMSDTMGQVYLKGEAKAQFLQPGLFQRGDYSEETSRRIDEEVKKIIDEQYQVALAILEKRRETIERAVKILLEQEKISGDELKQIMAETEPASTEAPQQG
jgi:cell division protease FtsH